MRGIELRENLALAVALDDGRSVQARAERRPGDPPAAAARFAAVALQ